MANLKPVPRLVDTIPVTFDSFSRRIESILVCPKVSGIVRNVSHIALWKFDAHGYAIHQLPVLVLWIFQICHINNAKQLHSSLASCVRTSLLACHPPCFVMASWTAVMVKTNLLLTVANCPAVSHKTWYSSVPTRRLGHMWTRCVTQEMTVAIVQMNQVKMKIFKSCLNGFLEWLPLISIM